MKQISLLIAAGALLLTACNGSNKEADQDSARIANLTAQYDEATSFNDSLMLLMGDIYTGLDSINMQEGLLNNIGANEGTSRRAEIQQNLRNIRMRLEANRKLLSEMEAKLNKSNNQNSVLSKTIAQMKERLAAQDERITQLEGSLQSANERIGELETTVTQKDEQLAVEQQEKEKAQQETIAAEAEANRVYYAIGTNKELKNKGLLEKKFLGATKVMKGDYDANYFTTADKRNLTVIPTGSKKVKIWSNMPEGSYNIEEAPDGTKSVRILNQQRFWSLTPYLIIQVN